MHAYQYAIYDVNLRCVYVCNSIHVCLFVSVFVCVCVCMCMCVHASLCVFLCAFVHLCMCVCVCVHVCACVPIALTQRKAKSKYK